MIRESEDSKGENMDSQSNDEVESKINKKTYYKRKFWLVLLGFIFVIGMSAKPLLRWYQDRASQSVYTTILETSENEDWYHVISQTTDYLKKYYGSSHYNEMKVLQMEASEKFACQNLSQLMKNSNLTQGEITTLFTLLKILGFDYFGSVVYVSGEVVTEGTLHIGYLSKNLGPLVIDYRDRKIARIYIAANIMNGNEPVTDFILFTDQDGILMSYNDVDREIKEIIDRFNYQ